MNIACIDRKWILEFKKIEFILMTLSITSHLHKCNGILCVGALALASYYIVSLPFLATTGITSLVIAILLGILVGNSWSYPAHLTPGIQFSAKRLLRTAIILYGFRISFQQIASVGLEAFFLDLFIVCSTLILGYLLGKKYFRLDHELALLVSAGSAICGAAAVLAVEDILKSEPHKTAIAIATVVLFGTLSMFLYPLLQHAHIFGFSETQFGIFTGSSIHEVAQALVAGSNVGLDAGHIAVIVKMMRVLLLVPVLFVLALLNQKKTSQNQDRKIKLTVPWFAIGFVMVIGLNSLHLFSNEVIELLNRIDIIFLTMAMCAIGLETKLYKMKKVGLTPLYLASLLFAWLIGSSWVWTQCIK